MTPFTNYLRKECELIMSGVELLKVYATDLEAGIMANVEDLRMAVYAMQIAFETSHVSKEESLLYPAVTDTNELTSESEKFLKRNIFEHEKGRHSLLSLRLAIDDYGRDPSEPGRLLWHLNDLINHVSSHLELEDERLFSIADRTLDRPTQKSLLFEAQKLECAPGMDHLRASKQIFNQLRKAKGMQVAS
jgi:hemerythrin-like domain-containing protein